MLVAQGHAVGLLRGQELVTGSGEDDVAPAVNVPKRKGIRLYAQGHVRVVLLGGLYLEAGGVEDQGFCLASFHLRRFFQLDL